MSELNTETPVVKKKKRGKLYGLAIGSSMRRDFGALYNRLIAEIQLYGEDGAQIMIHNGWLESPPQISED
ncbi:hypothetical protein JOC77_001906 [Peribacillus deserti]|uniref:DUF3231 family protein n=1 Tax=Peribacillus deserti TaxID=673318 RepID=A0ABS2QH26_9BACI|nr:hypothetical protein [Peribacillus deserti]